MICFVNLVIFLYGVVACANAICSNASICITSWNKPQIECQQHNIIHRLSELTMDQTSCRSVHIYLTSGVHILDRNLTIYDTVEQTEVRGLSGGQPSIIECENNARIKFSENQTVNNVLLSNVIFVHCGSHRMVNGSLIEVALYLKNASYTLLNVSVQNTKGHGLYADNCAEQLIVNCMFSNNTKHIHFIVPYSKSGGVLVSMRDTKFNRSDGKENSVSNKYTIRQKQLQLQYYQLRLPHKQRWTLGCYDAITLCCKLSN